MGSRYEVPHLRSHSKCNPACYCEHDPYVPVLPTPVLIDDTGPVARLRRLRAIAEDRFAWCLLTATYGATRLSRLTAAEAAEEWRRSIALDTRELRARGVTS